MATIGEIGVNITARTARFNKAIAKTRKGLRQFSTSARKSIGGVASSLKFLSGASVIGGLAGFSIAIRKAADEIDHIAKASDKLGLTTERLAGLRHGADLTGVSASTLEMAMQRLARRTSEAANGMGEARGAIKELNLDAKVLASLPVDQQLARIADKMLLVENSGDKMRLMMKLVDSEGVALLNTIKGGSKGLEEFQDMAEKLSLTFSRGDAAKVEEFNDAMTRLKATLGGTVRDITIDIAPAATKAINQFADSAPEWLQTISILGTNTKKFLEATGVIVAKRDKNDRRDLLQRQSEGGLFSQLTHKAFNPDQNAAKREAGAISEKDLIASGMAPELAKNTAKRLRGDTFSGGKDVGSSGLEAEKNAIKRKQNEAQLSSKLFGQAHGAIDAVTNRATGVVRSVVDKISPPSKEKDADNSLKARADKIGKSFEKAIKAQFAKNLLTGGPAAARARVEHKEQMEQTKATEDERLRMDEVKAKNAEVLNDARLRQAAEMQRALESRGANRIVDANTVEGFRALRANMRPQTDLAKKQLDELTRIRKRLASQDAATEQPVELPV